LHRIGVSCFIFLDFSQSCDILKTDARLIYQRQIEIYEFMKFWRLTVVKLPSPSGGNTQSPHSCQKSTFSALHYPVVRRCDFSIWNANWGIQILWSLQWSHLPILPFFGPHAVWYVSCHSLSRSWYTYLDNDSYCLPNLEIRLTCDRSTVDLTPPKHLIPPLIYSEVCVRPFSDLYFL
jgi:hypothetical protein